MSRYASSGVFPDAKDSAAIPGGLQLVKLPREDYPEAVCMDGSPAAYYHDIHQHNLLDQNAIIFLPGGNRCYTLSDCHRR